MNIKIYYKSIVLSLIDSIYKNKSKSFWKDNESKIIWRQLHFIFNIISLMRLSSTFFPLHCFPPRSHFHRSLQNSCLKTQLLLYSVKKKLVLRIKKNLRGANQVNKIDKERFLSILLSNNIGMGNCIIGMT